jgi:hypothetical protein
MIIEYHVDKMITIFTCGEMLLTHVYGFLYIIVIVVIFIQPYIYIQGILHVSSKVLIHYMVNRYLLEY